MIRVVLYELGLMNNIYKSFGFEEVLDLCWFEEEEEEEEEVVCLFLRVLGLKKFWIYVDFSS